MSDRHDMDLEEVEMELPPTNIVVVDNEMGYEECYPQVRRGSMTIDQEKERRASIKAVMADPTLSPLTKRRSIQHLMDGRRNSIENSNSNSPQHNNHRPLERRHSTQHTGRRNSVSGGTTSLTTGTASICSGSNHSLNSFGERRNSDWESSSDRHNNFNCEDGMDHVDEGYRYMTQNDMGYDDYGDNNNHENGGGLERGFRSNGGLFTISNDQTRLAEQSRPSCTHYDRRCTMIAPCCGAAFGCRICHDECPALPPKINNGDKRMHRSASLPSSFTSMPLLSEVPQDNHHTIDRFAVVEVICRECFTRQSSKTNQCVTCRVQFGAYHCSICNLWMSDKERPYHCVDCGFCRVGGADNFLHCHQCGMCIDRTLYNNHNCKEGKYRSNCPVCQEYLFNSRGASHEMPCGHAIHWDCFRQMAAHDSRCPVCKKTAETRERMMPTWNAMAAGIAMQPVPPELARVVNITCNDCERSEDGAAWHFLGMQCSSCSSFNTVVDQILLQGEEAHEFLEMKRQRTLAMEQQNNNVEGESNSGEVDPSRRGGGRPHRVNRRRSAFG